MKTVEQRLAAVETQCAACAKRRKRRRKMGFDTNAEATSLAGSVAVFEQDRAPDELGDVPEDRR